MKTRHKILLATAVVAFMAVAVAALHSGDGSLRRVVSARTIAVGYAVEPPYAFVLPDGTVTGQSPETAKLIAERLGIDSITWRVAEFGALIDELERGRVDVIAAGMFITPERAARVAFSEPVARVAQAMLVARGNPMRIGSHRDAVASPGVKVAALSGSVEERLLKRMGLPEQRMVRVPDAAAGRAAVENGIAHALALSAPTIRWMAANDQLGRTEMAEPFEQPGPDHPEAVGFVAFAFRKQDKRLLDAWNAQIETLLHQQEYRELVEPFGFTSFELPAAGQARAFLGK